MPVTYKLGVLTCSKTALLEGRAAFGGSLHHVSERMSAT